MFRLIHHNFRTLNRRLILPGAVALLTIMAGVVLAPRVQAGPVTNPGAAPYTKLGVYQGVISIVPDGTNALELGNAGTDIASTGDLYLRPDSAPRDAAKNVRAYLKTIGANQLGSIAVPGELCLGGICQTTFNAVGTGILGSGDSGTMPRFSGTSALQNSDVCQDSYGRIGLYPGGAGANCANAAPTEMLSITGLNSVNANRTQIGVGRTGVGGTEVLFGLENTFTSYPPVVKGGADGDGFIQMKNIVHRFNIALDTVNYPILSFEKDSVAIGVPFLTPLPIGGYYTPHAKLDVYNNWTDDVGDPANTIGAYVNSLGSAVYAQQNGSGYAGYFKGNVTIAGALDAVSLKFNGISKSTWMMQVCQVGVDTCLGQYLYTTGSAPSAQYCYYDGSGTPCVNIMNGASPAFELR